MDRMDREYDLIGSYKRADGSVVEFGLEEGARKLQIKVNGASSYPKIRYFYQKIFGDTTSARYALAQMYAEGFKRSDLLDQEIADNE